MSYRLKYNLMVIADLDPSSGRLAECSSFSPQSRTTVRSLVYQDSASTPRFRHKLTLIEFPELRP
jgi:hypothetical protein